MNKFTCVSALCACMALLGACSKDDPIYNTVPKVNVKEETMDTLTELHCTPNPVAQQTMVSFNLTRAQQLHIKVFNAVGYMRYEYQGFPASAGYNSFPLDLTGWEKGKYFLVITVNGRNHSIQIVKAE